LPIIIRNPRNEKFTGHPAWIYPGLRRAKEMDRHFHGSTNSRVAASVSGQTGYPRKRYALPDVLTPIVTRPGMPPTRKPDYCTCEALLAKDSVTPANPQDKDLHRGQSVLITGAGGSIGSALARQIATFEPRQLVLLDSAEHGLFALEPQLAEISCSLPRHMVVGCVANQALIRDLLKRYRPELIYHAAAHKHVPLMEHNPFAAISNNALSTWRLAEAVAGWKDVRLLMISTDKAANPASMMGASKRIAEIALQTHSHAATPMSSIRLGNVLGTQGSVLATFSAQLAAGEPLTVTHPEMQRYFLRSEQAIALIFEAMRCAPPGEVVAPVQQTTVRILELANYLIAQHRAQCTEAPEIIITGLRPGEKLHEVFAGDGEVLGDPISTCLRRLESAYDARAVHAAIDALQRAVHARDLQSLLQIVQSLVPDYAVSSFLTQEVNSKAGHAHV
jgi:FlaA1/EpsC-like NDP-sugar epimerase